MAQKIEDYALLGNCQTAALVGRDGSIDWLCVPRFDAGACFAALLGGPEHGRWQVAPRDPLVQTRRAYRDGSLVLDTTFETAGGEVTLTDFMPLGETCPSVVRTVKGVRGRVRMRTELVVRFDYGSIVPWVRKATAGHGISAIAGPESIRLQSPVPLYGENLTTLGEFDAVEGDVVSFVLSWGPSHARDHRERDAASLLEHTESAWRKWSAQCSYEGPWRDAVLRSLVTLKGLTYTATGGMVAAPTTSLPEALGGQRNWDYRYCWVRDATFTLLALMHNGFVQEARDWREWLLRAVAGDPSKLQIMYGIDGGRRLGEQEIPWLPGYEGARPVRTGNAAFAQRQLDVYGEVMDALFQFRPDGMHIDEDAWNMRQGMLEFLETCWDQPDEGIWEVRGPPRNFTHSKVMAWVAFDRAVRRLEAIGHTPEAKTLLGRWRTLRARMHDEICDRGFDTEINAFVQSYGSKKLDASVLMIPLVGFLPGTDPRVVGTARAVEARLLEGGFVRRYESDASVDGLPEGEGVFLPCSFWLADNWGLMNREAEAREMFERLLGLCNDVGLLSEEYDPASKRLVGNFPQAFSHVSLVNTARNLSHPHGSPVRRRSAKTA